MTDDLRVESCAFEEAVELEDVLVEAVSRHSLDRADRNARSLPLLGTLLGTDADDHGGVSSPPDARYDSLRGSGGPEPTAPPSARTDTAAAAGTERWTHSAYWDLPSVATEIGRAMAAALR